MSIPKSTEDMEREATEAADNSSSLMCHGKWLDCNLHNRGEMAEYFTWWYGGRSISKTKAAELIKSRPEKKRVR